MTKEEKRKFPRVNLRGQLAELDHFIGIEIKWPQGQMSRVLDMSYGGASVVRPLGLALQQEQSLTLEFYSLTSEKQSGQQRINLPCQVRRLGEGLVGLAFTQLNTEARRGLEDFLKEKILGLGLKLVNPHYYGSRGSGSDDFSYWFHGPNGTNVFLWTEENNLERALVELDGSLLLYQQGQFFEAKGSREQNPQKLTALEGSQRSHLMNQTLELISQISENRELLEPLITALSRS